MNRRDFLKWCGKGVITIGTISLLPDSLDKEKKGIKQKITIKNPAVSLREYVDHIDTGRYIKNYCTQDAKLSWYFYQLRLEAKRTGKVQIAAQQKRNINKLYGKYG